jgi:hypothetical protein
VYTDQVELDTMSLAGRHQKDVSYKFKDPVVATGFGQALTRHIASLPKSWQQVYELKLVLDMDSPAICNELNLSPADY